MGIQPSRRQFLGRAGAGLAAAAVASPLLAACGSSSKSSSTSATGGTGTAKRGGTLRFAVAGGASADTPDPALAGTSFTLYMAANLYDTLVRADQNFGLTPALATSWSSSPDAKSWSFKLRDGVTFHGGGKLTAKDVAYSITRILSPKLASPALANISPFLKASGISAPDPTTVKFALSAPNAFFPQILAGLNFGIIPDGTT